MSTGEAVNNVRGLAWSAVRIGSGCWSKSGKLSGRGAGGSGGHDVFGGDIVDSKEIPVMISVVAWMVAMSRLGSGIVVFA